MACITLKRPLEFDPIYHSAGTGCSPRPTKRQRCLAKCIPVCSPSRSSAVATTLPSSVSPLPSSSSSPSCFSLPSSCSTSLFSSPATAVTLSSNTPVVPDTALPPSQQPFSKQYHLTLFEDINKFKQQHKTPTTAKSPATKLSMDEESSDESSMGSPRSCSPLSQHSLSPSSKDKPILTFTQVNQVCTELLRQRESAVREQYDSVLMLELGEHYQRCVNFTAEQIRRRMADQGLPSYLS